MLIRGRSTRVSQPTGPVEIDWANPLTSGLGFNLCNFLRRDAAGDALITSTANLAQSTTTLGQGLSSAANAAFSAPLDLSGTSEITVAFILKRNTATGTQVLVEHTINQNTQAGSFLIYTDTTNFLASISNGVGGSTNFNVASCAAPAVGTTTKIVVTLARRGTSAQACRIWYDGIEQVTTQPNTGSISGAFANSTTYFFGRAASSLFTNGVIHDISLWRRSISDNEIQSWSDSPWTLYRPAERRVWFSVVGGGGKSQSVAFTLEDVAAAVSQTLSHNQSLSGTLDGVTVSISQTLSHSQALSASLDGVTVAASQTLSHSQALAATLDGITVAINQSAAPSSKEQALAITLDGIAFDAVQVGALPAVGGMGFTLVDMPSTMWWKRKPKAITEEVAKKKIKRVVRAIEQATREQVAQPAAQQQREVYQAIAPLLEEMPGFDWKQVFRLIVAQDTARRQMEATIARAKQIEQDDEDVLMLLLSH